MRSVCGRVKMSRQNYYARRRQRQRLRVDGDWVAQRVRKERQLQPRIGTRKLQALLKEELVEAGVKLGRDRMFEELRARDLLVKRRRGGISADDLFGARFAGVSQSDCGAGGIGT